MIKQKIGYLALSLYLLLVSLLAIVPNLIIPNTLMAALAFIASLGIFLDVCIPSKAREKRMSYSPVPVSRNISENKQN